MNGCADGVMIITPSGTFMEDVIASEMPKKESRYARILTDSKLFENGFFDTPHG